MDYFDLHCDTITEAYSKQFDLTSEKLSVNIKNTEKINKYTQCFALWLNDDFHGKAAFEKASALYDFYQTQKPLITSNGIRQILTLENAASLGGDIENIAVWKERSVAAMTLTWNAKNELACGADVLSGGLTKLGKAVVRQAQIQNIIIDVSHLNEDSFCDVAKILHKPFIASHSCCFSVCPHRRNLKDYQIKEIISSGGLIGINFYPAFLGGGNVFEAIYKNICHILKLGGDKNIAFGSDFDGAKMANKLKDLSCVNRLYTFLLNKGIDAGTLDNIFFNNAEIFFNNAFSLS